ncbi:hypothetical protein LMG31841_05448 [Paraburkholderia saeva]|uniref:UspA domain-containing protein n=2 Tax=Paraburkholderia saeva TaxID=2777537 RepID=A0A9N8S2N1_9BURK|nr:hypothetical protein LMG31841_05448 [Paraburkholderia saeva]
MAHEAPDCLTLRRTGARIESSVTSFRVFRNASYGIVPTTVTIASTLSVTAARSTPEYSCRRPARDRTFSARQLLPSWLLRKCAAVPHPMEALPKVNMFRRILVAIDGSETARQAFEAALQLARESSAQLLPLYVVDNPLMAYDALAYDPSILREACLEAGRGLAAAALAEMKRAAVAGTPRIVEVDHAGEDIAERIRITANEFAADLIVLGTHGRRGFRRLFLGSVAERVVRIACCPVLLVPGQHGRQTSTPAAAREPADEPL